MTAGPPVEYTCTIRFVAANQAVAGMVLLDLDQVVRHAPDGIRRIAVQVDGPRLPSEDFDPN